MAIIADGHVFSDDAILRAEWWAAGDRFTVSIGAYDSNHYLVGYYDGYYGQISPEAFNGYVITVFREDKTATSIDNAGGLGLGFKTKPPYNTIDITVGTLGTYRYTYNKYSEGSYTYSTNATNRKAIANYLDKYYGKTVTITLSVVS